jgi:hypothetical protein
MARKKYKCIVSGKDIPHERVEALKMLGVPETRWTCVEHALDVPRKGIYLGEAGTSELLIVDKVYNDSVRSVFRGSRKEVAVSQKEDNDIDATPAEYDSKEIEYYNSNEEQLDPEENIEIIKRQEP